MREIQNIYNLQFHFNFIFKKQILVIDSMSFAYNLHGVCHVPAHRAAHVMLRLLL